ncbi:RHS repeat-associated core domain-containing protein [Streptomyces sp. NBC_00435]|uniref:RHS repeat-associated core domain-containing protein n=1 Tax=Streptomyces sp. NBC_00435 TaxID=2903649 RepID=UPI003FA7A66C
MVRLFELGSTRALTDGTGAVTGIYSHTPYRSVSGHTGAVTPLQFSGQYPDAETGPIYLRAHYFDPSTAQFLTVDPEVRATQSAYGYVDNNPLNPRRPEWNWLGARLGGVAAALAAPEALAAFAIAVVVVVVLIASSGPLSRRSTDIPPYAGGKGKIGSETDGQAAIRIFTENFGRCPTPKDEGDRWRLE